MKEVSHPSYKIPENIRVYAIGDIHGYAEVLDKMHEAIAIDMAKGVHPAQVHIIYLGDYGDRGPDSRGVIERLIERKARKDSVMHSFLLGNHETAIFEFMDGPYSSDWLKYGGVEFLRSYGIVFENEDLILPGEAERAALAMRKAIPAEHFDFLEHLQVAVEIGGYLFAHAGIDPRKSLSEQTIDDFTRIRQPFLSWHQEPKYKPLSHRVVHGHSIHAEPCLRPHRIGIDTGAFKGGPLTAAVLEGTDVRFLQVGCAR